MPTEASAIEKFVKFCHFRFLRPAEEQLFFFSFLFLFVPGGDLLRVVMDCSQAVVNCFLQEDKRDQTLA